MKRFAVIDTNVLAPALLRWDSVPGAVVEQALVGSIVPLLNDQILEEEEGFALFANRAIILEKPFDYGG